MIQKETFNLCRQNKVRWLVLIGCLPLQFEAFVQLVFVVRSSFSTFLFRKTTKKCLKEKLNQETIPLLASTPNPLRYMTNERCDPLFLLLFLFLHDALIRVTNLTECLLFPRWHFYSFKYVI